MNTEPVATEEPDFEEVWEELNSERDKLIADNQNLRDLVLELYEIWRNGSRSRYDSWGKRRYADLEQRIEEIKKQHEMSASERTKKKAHALKEIEDEIENLDYARQAVIDDLAELYKKRDKLVASDPMNTELY